MAAAAAAAGEAQLLADTELQMRGSAGIQCVSSSTCKIRPSLLCSCSSRLCRLQNSHLVCSMMSQHAAIAHLLRPIRPEMLQCSTVSHR